MLAKLVIGDPSDDGHGRTDDYYYEINVETYSQLLSAYQRGVKICGVDLTKNICCEYEDSGIKISDLRKLLAHGVLELTEENLAFIAEDIVADSFDEIDDNEYDHYFFGNFDNYHEIWLGIAKLGQPNLVYTSSSSYIEEFHIGGYGLRG